MSNYPCPPVGFKFTEENIKEAKAFYALWLIQVGAYNERSLQKGEGKFKGTEVCLANIEYNVWLPWIVQELNTKNPKRGKSDPYTFTETTLPEGETE